jgi:hypothetical protein
LDFLIEINPLNVYNWLWIKDDLFKVIDDWEKKYNEIYKSIDDFSPDIGFDLRAVMFLSVMIDLNDIDKNMVLFRVASGYQIMSTGRIGDIEPYIF